MLNFKFLFLISYLLLRSFFSNKVTVRSAAAIISVITIGSIVSTPVDGFLDVPLGTTFVFPPLLVLLFALLLFLEFLLAQFYLLFSIG